MARRARPEDPPALPAALQHGRQSDRAEAVARGSSQRDDQPAARESRTVVRRSTDVRDPTQSPCRRCSTNTGRYLGAYGCGWTPYRNHFGQVTKSGNQVRVGVRAEFVGGVRAFTSPDDPAAPGIEALVQVARCITDLGHPCDINNPRCFHQAIDHVWCRPTLRHVIAANPRVDETVGFPPHALKNDLGNVAGEPRVEPHRQACCFKLRQQLRTPIYLLHQRAQPIVLRHERPEESEDLLHPGVSWARALRLLNELQNCCGLGNAHHAVAGVATDANSRGALQGIHEATMDRIRVGNRRSRHVKDHQVQFSMGGVHLRHARLAAASRQGDEAQTTPRPAQPGGAETVF